MTLIELLVFIFMIAIGGWIAGLLYPIGGLWLAVPGFVAGVLVIPGISLAHTRYRNWAFCGNEFMPPCSCGSKTFKVEVAGKNEFHEVCQSCGRRFNKRRDKVYSIAGDKRVPYMHLVKHKGWIDWNSQPPATGD